MEESHVDNHARDINATRLLTALTLPLLNLQNMPSSESDTSARLEEARGLKSNLENIPLHITRGRQQFDAKHLSSLAGIDPTFDPAAGPLDPALVSLNVASQIVSMIL